MDITFSGQVQNSNDTKYIDSIPFIKSRGGKNDVIPEENSLRKTN